MQRQGSAAGSRAGPLDANDVPDHLSTRHDTPIDEGRADTPAPPAQAATDDGFSTETDEDIPAELLRPTSSPASSIRMRRSRLSRLVPRSPTRRIPRKVPRRRSQDDLQRRRALSEPDRLPWAFEYFLVRPLEVVIHVCTRLVLALLSPLTSLLPLILCGVVGFAVVVYLAQQPLLFWRRLVAHPTRLLRPRLVLDIPRVAYCSTVGIGCRKTFSKDEEVAILARTTAEHAHQAHDIFQSVVRLGDPRSLGLHHPEMWELAVAVRATSHLETKDDLSRKLKDLGDLTRDVKDAVIGINSKAINTFSWTVEAFKRVEVMIQHMKATGTYSHKAVAKQIDSLFERLNYDLNDLLQLIEHTIPGAARGSMLGHEILEDFSIEQLRLRQSKEDTPLWRNLLSARTFKGRQLARDLDLTSSSIRNMQSMARNLDEARSFLVGYRDHTAYFKAGITGQHLSDNLLLPEHEVEALQAIMGRFTSSVHAIKAGKSSAYTSAPAIESKPASLWDVD